MHGQHKALRAEFDKLAKRLKKTKDGSKKDRLLEAMNRLCGAARNSILNPAVHNPPPIHWERYRRIWPEGWGSRTATRPCGL